MKTETRFDFKIPTRESPTWLTMTVHSEIARVLISSNVHRAFWEDYMKAIRGEKI